MILILKKYDTAFQEVENVEKTKLVLFYETPCKLTAPIEIQAESPDVCEIVSCKM